MMFATHSGANIFKRARLAIGGGLELSQHRTRRKLERFGRYDDKRGHGF